MSIDEKRGELSYDQRDRIIVRTSVVGIVIISDVDVSD